MNSIQEWKWAQILNTKIDTIQALLKQVPPARSVYDFGQTSYLFDILISVLKQRVP